MAAAVPDAVADDAFCDSVYFCVRSNYSRSISTLMHDLVYHNDKNEPCTARDVYPRQDSMRRILLEQYEYELASRGYNLDSVRDSRRDRPIERLVANVFTPEERAFVANAHVVREVLHEMMAQDKYRAPLKECRWIDGPACDTDVSFRQMVFIRHNLCLAISADDDETRSYRLTLGIGHNCIMWQRFADGDADIHVFYFTDRVTLRACVQNAVDSILSEF